MMKRTTLTLTGSDHRKLQTHLICGDDNEAAAILICRETSGGDRLLVRDVILVPHDACPVRTSDRIVWPGIYIEEAIDRAEADGSLIFLTHSHPGGSLEFSKVDDDSDAATMPGLFAAIGNAHGSAIMTPDGAMRARLYGPDMSCRSIDLVVIAGDDIRYCWSGDVIDGLLPAWPLAFTTGMRNELGRLSFAIIGVSGTGSLVAEQLARMGGGKITLIDFDRVERRNLNRIIYSTLVDADRNALKAEVFAAAITAYRGPDVAVAVPVTVNSREAVFAAAACDVIFCCVDTQEARQIADLIAAAFLIPLFDVGVVIPTRKAGDNVAIAEVCGRIDYVQPGGSTLGNRGVYSPEGLRAEYLRSADPEAFEQEFRAGYIKGVIEQAPSVISLNMRASSALVMEYIARVFPFRHEPNRKFARTSFSLAAGEEEFQSEDSFPLDADSELARGDEEPLLGIPALGRTKRGTE